MKLREQIHWYAGVLLLTLCVYALGGVLWGVLRPKYQATITNAQGELEVNNVINVEFTGFMWFVVATGVLAFILTDCILANRSWLHRWLGPAPPALMDIRPFLWVGLCIWFGAIAFVEVGELATILIFGIPTQESDFVAGEVITYVPRLDAGRTGFLLAPAVSLLYYWTAILVEPRARPVTTETTTT